jgi:hypothetical protein
VYCFWFDPGYSAAGEGFGLFFSLNISGCCDFARLEDEVGKSEVEDEDEDERDS